jgi:ATP-binding cassette subfamily B protein
VNQIIFLKLSEKSNTDLRNYLFKKIYNMPINFFDTIPTGDIMSRAINDIDSLGQAMSQNLANFLYYALEIILLLTIMFLVNAMLAIFGIILIPLSILLNALVIKRIQPFFKKQQKYLGDLNGLIEENVSGMKVISLFNMKKETEKDFEEINKKHMHNSIVASASSNIMLPLNIFINNISFVLFTTIGIFGLFFGGNSGNG